MILQFSEKFCVKGAHYNHSQHNIHSGWSFGTCPAWVAVWMQLSGMKYLYRYSQFFCLLYELHSCYYFTPAIMASLLAVDFTACQQQIAFTCAIAVILSASWRCCCDHQESLVSWVISNRMVHRWVRAWCTVCGQWISAELCYTLCVFSTPNGMLCNHETCIAPFDSDMRLEKVNVSARTVFSGGDVQMRACVLYFHPVYFICVRIVGSFLSVIVFYFVLALDITEAAFVIKKPNREHILCDQSWNLVFFM